MKKTLVTIFLISSSLLSFAQYDNSEKLSVLVGFVSSGSEFVFWSDNVTGATSNLFTI